MSWRRGKYGGNFVIVVDQRMDASSKLRIDRDIRRCHRHRRGARVRAWSADGGEGVGQGGGSTEGVPAKGCCPQRGTAGLGLNRHRPCERCRHDLTPQIGAERSTRCSNGLHRSNSVEGIHDCGKLEADAFQRSADEMTACVVGSDSQIGAGDIRVPQRCTFAEYVWQHQQALTAGGDLCRELKDSDIGGTFADQVRCERLPAQRNVMPPLLMAPPITQTSSVRA